MGELIIFLPIVIIIIAVLLLAPVINAVKNQNSAPAAKNNASRDIRYNRQADAIHTTRDAAAERRHRLDQLKSLYEAGMMEKEEYNERVESVEADYRGRY